ncbi:alpha/beta hydrolase [Candidatus Desantisbacteria bacterium]|nr:alpha/beta hydrolase [Candidatus Desantisbacteria bacterium]
MKIAIGFILILLGFLVFVRFMEPGFIYYPSKEIDKIPSVDIACEEVFFRTEDREILWGIFVPAKQENAGVIIYFHGNAGNISGRMDIIFNLYKLGYNVFAFDYRGYGKSSGKPDEEGLYKDGRAADLLPHLIWEPECFPIFLYIYFLIQSLIL